MKEFVKEKEEENKKGGKARSVRSSKVPAKTLEKKGKQEKVSTPKNKSKLQLKEKPDKKVDKLNQTAKHSDNKKLKFGKEKESKEEKEKKEKEKKEKQEKLQKEKEEKKKLAEQKKKKKKKKQKKKKRKKKKKPKKEKKKKKKKIKN